MFDRIHDGRIKAVWIIATNPVVSLPDADKVRAALRKCEFVVVSDVVANTDTAGLAHVLLPALAWGEKDGTVTNSDRTISRQRQFLPAPGEARADWRIMCDVARAMGFSGFDFVSPHEIFREHARLTAYNNDGTARAEPRRMGRHHGRGIQDLAARGLAHGHVRATGPAGRCSRTASSCTPMVARVSCR